MKRKINNCIALFVTIFMCFAFLGCEPKKPQTEKEVLNMLRSVNNYTSNVEINIINNREKITFAGYQKYEKGKLSSLKLNNNRELSYKDGKLYINDIQNNKKYEMNQEFDVLYKISFLDEYTNLLYSNKKINYTYKTINGVEYIVIDLDLPYMNKNLSRAELYFDYQTRIPDKIIIYDNKNVEKVNIIYKNFINK